MVGNGVSQEKYTQQRNKPKNKQKPSMLVATRVIQMAAKRKQSKKPAKGKAKVKITPSGKKVSYGQAGKAKDGGARVKPGTPKGDAYCARSSGQMKDHPKAAKDPNSPLRLSRKRWKCKGKKSSK